MCINTTFLLQVYITNDLDPFDIFLQQKRKLHEILVLEHNNVRLKDKQP